MTNQLVVMNHKKTGKLCGLDRSKRCSERFSVPSASARSGTVTSDGLLASSYSPPVERNVTGPAGYVHVNRLVPTEDIGACSIVLAP